MSTISNNRYYPNKKLDPVAAHNQPYPSPNYYPYPEPNNIYCLNPLSLKSLKNVDIDNLQEVFGKGIQEEKYSIIGRQLENERIFNEDPEINEIRNSIKHAKLNKVLAKQIHQNHYKRIQNLINDTKADEEVLKEIQKQDEIRKKNEEKILREKEKTKLLIEQQMKEKERMKMNSEAQKEYEKDRKDIEKLMKNMYEEDLALKEEENRKKKIARAYMEQAYIDKELKKKKEKEEEELQKEKERKYFEERQKFADEISNKKAAKEFEKNQIFNKLCEQEAQRKAQQDYWENIRNELNTEQENQRLKLAELAEKEKLQKQREEMIESEIAHRKAKEENKKKEKELENIFKKELMEKFEKEEKLEKLNIEKRKQKELNYKREIEKQWQDKLKQYQLQKENELKNLEKLKIEEQAKRYLIEQEKMRLLKENGDLLKRYYPLGYTKAINSIEKQKIENNNYNNFNKDTKYDIIKNNIFGNSNPNKSSAYPKYGNIKNFVYDKSIQDIHPKINIINYNMYNASANNDYDSYPTPEEYLKVMKSRGQKNYAYAGNTDTTGLAMRSQLPVYAGNLKKKGISKSISCGNIMNKNMEINYNRNNVNRSIGSAYPASQVQKESNNTLYGNYRVVNNDMFNEQIKNGNNTNYNYNRNMQEKIAEPMQ